MMVLAGILAVGAFVSVRVWRATDGGRESAPTAGGATGARDKFTGGGRPVITPVHGTTGVASGGVWSPDKVARIEKIRRDYDEIRTKMSADYGAAGDKFPGGVSAFLKQLALLEREMHADFAAVLTPRELEDYEMSESTTGQALRRRLGDAAVTDEQRRAVFRLQREFDDRFALVFDVSPAALAERTKLQQMVREKVRALVGDAVFATWLSAEDPSYAAMRTMAAQAGLPGTTVEELWRIKNEFILGRLEIAAQAGLTAPQRAAMQAALADQARSRVSVLVRPEALQPGNEALAWLPSRR